jgi:uncharacterized OB-fold protein
MGESIVEKKGKATVAYRWSYGQALTRFFEATRDRKVILGSRCPACKGVLVPPSTLCGRCFAETEPEPVEVSDHGVLQTFTTVYLPFPGQPTTPPYTTGLIVLDGSDTAIQHLVGGIDPKDVSCGMRVRAVWSEERRGDLHDIVHFAPER